MHCPPYMKSRFPIPDSRFPIPDSRFPIPYSLLPTPFKFKQHRGVCCFVSSGNCS
ncbi:hypothetical protein [Moorena producens]|uniref:hypothetical protein n=1 Tax=Moorena producens TaxID=1155739 RepID=UPI003C76233B